MNPEAQAQLNEILAKNPENLTDNEKAFLRARVSYLKKAQLKEYEDILNPKAKPAAKQTVNKNANTDTK